MRYDWVGAAGWFSTSLDATVGDAIGLAEARPAEAERAGLSAFSSNNDAMSVGAALVVIVAIALSLVLPPGRRRWRKAFRIVRDLARFSLHVLRRLPLLPAVGAAVLGGVALAWLADWVLRTLTETEPDEAGPIDVAKLPLTIVAGAGVSIALFVGVRRQREVEAAADLIASGDVATGKSGVDALARVADRATGLRRQESIDALCNRLRDAKTGSDIRKEIVRVVSQHLQPDAESSWSASNFDFQSAILEDADFTAAVFTGASRFDKATLLGASRFNDASFANAAHFDAAIFDGPADFHATTFMGTARFDGAEFGSTATFDGATFGGVAAFSGAQFGGNARFDEAMLVGNARLHDVAFARAVAFDTSTFGADARFSGASFKGDARFGGATFSGNTRFYRARFASEVRFDSATFAGDAQFDVVTFAGDAGFDGTTFAGDAWFGYAWFGRDAEFANARFTANAGFRGVAFTGARSSFEHADFGSKAVTFEYPNHWGPPAPTFDWDEAPWTKPGNVKPEDWPPTPYQQEP